MNNRTTCLALLLALPASSAAQQSGSLTTTFQGDDPFAGAMFDLVAKETLTVTGFDVHFEDEFHPAPCGLSCSVTEVLVFHRQGSWKGHATTPADWIQLGSVQHTISTGAGVPQPLNLPIGIDMHPATQPQVAFYVTNSGYSNSQTGEVNELMFLSPPATHSTAALTFKSGVANEFIWTNSFKRTWNGTVYYDQPGVVNYCTSGTSASGCHAILAASGTPSASASSGFFLSASDVEGAKDGLFFFGTGGKQANPWGNGTSYQCVVPPVKRTGLLAGVGTSGACDGTFARDLNAFWCPSCPGSHKNPGSGAVVQAQLWYRDPANTSNQSTSLSDAVEFAVTP